MRDLIDDLLEYSKLEMLGKPFAPVSMNTVVARTITSSKASIDESQAEIMVGTLPTIDAHENQLIQRMQNLIGNAIKFRGSERPRIRVSASESSEGWVFSVQG